MDGVELHEGGHVIEAFEEWWKEGRVRREESGVGGGDGGDWVGVGAVAEESFCEELLEEGVDGGSGLGWSGVAGEEDGVELIERATLFNELEDGGGGGIEAVKDAGLGVDEHRFVVELLEDDAGTVHFVESGQRLRLLADEGFLAYAVR